MAGPFNVPAGMKRTVMISGFLSADDKPATVDGPPTGELDNDGGTLVVSADGMTMTVSNVAMAPDAPPRTVRLTMKADANRDPNVQDFITDFVDFIMEAAASPVATHFGLTVGEPEAQ